MNVTALKIVRDLLGGDTFPGCESASLRLEKFVRLGKTDAGMETRRAEIEAFVSKRAELVPPLKNFAPRGAKRFVATLGGRMIVDQAGGILENAGLCLHPHFNAPCIPGSALKGVARHAAWCEWHDESDETRKAELAKQLAEVFGYPTMDDGLDAYLAERGWKDRRHAGAVSFLAAVPAIPARLVVDLVNCHHHKYYSGQLEEARDVENPIPNFFPAVREGAQFVFTLVPLRGATEKSLAWAYDWLLKGIQCQGVGAKTAAGYGWFLFDEEKNKIWCEREAEGLRLEDRKQKVQEICRRIDALAAMPDSETVDPSFRAELDAIEADVQNLYGGEGWNYIDQPHREECRRQRARLPQQSPLDALREKWEKSTVNGVVYGKWMRETLNVTTSLKKFEMTEDVENIVRLLREPSGIGADVWKELCQLAANSKKCSKDKFKHIPIVVAAARYFSAHQLGLGEMPK